MNQYLNLILRLTIWLLLTADLSVINILIGIGIVMILPRGTMTPAALKDWLHVLSKAVIAIPIAYGQAVEIMIRPHTREVIAKVRVESPRAPALVFLDVFVITFTPKTLVTNYHEVGWYEIHRLQRRGKS
jgi:multicomponent Na+:H+ antiporter subunit E